MKKTFSTIALLLMCLAAWAATKINGIYYKFNSDGTAEVTNACGGNYDCSTKYSGSVTIPSSVTYNDKTYSVTSIGNYAFQHCSGLTSITIPNSVISIGFAAFEGCTSFASVTIPNSVTGIDKYAFTGCTGLTSVTIPKSVTSIEERVFQGCSGLTNVTIPNSVTSIGSYAFSSCTSLTSVTIPQSVTSIEERVFQGCSGLTSVTIGNSVTSIGSYAFSSCTSLTSVTIPQSVTNIEERVFQGCSGLTSVTIGNSVTSIGNHAFYDCTGLTSIIIPNSVTSIGNYAFYDCTSLQYIVYAGTATGSPWGASSSIVYAVKDGYLLFRDAAKTILGKCLPEATGSISIPNSVTSIGNSVFSGCTGLKSVTIPNSVTSIGSNAFYGCTKLTSITIPESVTSIGNSAFRNCTGLTSVVWNATNCAGFSSSDYNPFYDIREQITSFVLGNAVQKIPNYLCYGMINLTSVTIPTSVTSIGNTAFSGCTGLTSIIIPNSVTSIGFAVFYGCTGLTSIIIPNSVTSIGGYAFSGCTSLTSIEIPNSVTSIGERAFESCTSLTSITIPNSVTNVGENAFQVCTNLQYIFYAGSATGSPWGASSSIVYAVKDGYLLFRDAAKTILGKCLPEATGSISIPESVTSIESGAFLYCMGLTSVVWNAKNCNSAPFSSIRDNITSFVFGNEVENIPSSLCYGMKNLTSISIPESVTSIGDNAFYRCTGLTSITIGNSVTSIGDNAFRCTGLTSIIIPNSVTSIGGYAFSGCTSLTSIEIPNSVTNIGINPFAGCSGLTCILVETGNANYDNRNNCNAIIETATNTLIFGCQGTVIPNGVTKIGSQAFKDCTGLTSVTIPNSVTSIESQAFSGCTGLGSVVLGSGMKTIYYDAFNGCTGLQSITCYSMRPPTTIDGNNQTNRAFETLPYSTIVYVPADYLTYYMVHDLWGLYDVRSLGAASVHTDDLTVTPHQTTVDITWPLVANAASYEITITSNGITVCTLTFNAQGQLTNIAFRAPAAEPARAAGQGFQFTVTGLEDGSAYSLTLNAKDAVGNVLRTFTQNFSTGYTAIEEAFDDGISLKPRKVLEEGRVIILMPDGRKFDANGRVLK